MDSKADQKASTPPLSFEKMFILDQCIIIETRCGDLYRAFAELHSDLTELQTLWLKTALEEDHHALQFKMLARLKGEGLTDVNTDISSTSAIIHNLDSLLTQVKECGITPMDALKLAIKLEAELSQYHSDSIVTCGDPEMQKLLKAMMTNDAGHVKMLEQALEKMTGSEN